MSKLSIKRCPRCDATVPLLGDHYVVYRCLNPGCKTEYFCSNGSCEGGLFTDSRPDCHGTLFGTDKVETGKTEGGCFLTTALVHHLGLADNCRALRDLRALRSAYVVPSRRYADVLGEYRRTSMATLGSVPMADSTTRAAVFVRVRDDIVVPSCRLFEDGRLREAFERYESATRQLATALGARA